MISRGNGKEFLCELKYDDFGVVSSHVSYEYDS